LERHGKAGEVQKKGRLTTAVDAAPVGGDGRDEDYAAPFLGFHVFDDAFDEDEGGAEVYG
jgi:hypothetical protein